MDTSFTISEEMIEVAHGHRPKGPNNSWKTGQRVPVSGDWADQYGLVTSHLAGATFPPCLDRKGESAHRTLVHQAADTA